MAEKYNHLDKKMLTFTIPSHIKGKTIKKGRYTKLKYLLELRAYLSKCFNNTDGIKYFMNIELGKAYSNPHLHIQLWHDKSATSSINLIKQKAISKFNLNENRCITTEPTHDNIFYTYVIKDYSKSLTDKELWALEIQKKRMREQLGSKVRFYSKSGDKYSQKVYKIFYRYYSCVRKYANEFIEKFIGMFFFKQIPQQKVLRYFFSNLSQYIYSVNIEQVRYILLFIFYVIPSCLDPPFVFISPILLTKSIFA